MEVVLGGPGSCMRFSAALPPLLLTAIVAKKKNSPSLNADFKLCMALPKLVAWNAVFPEKQHACQAPA